MLQASLRALRRRWYVALVGLLSTGVLAVCAMAAVRASYVSTAQMVLLPPHSRQSGDLANQNPFLNLFGLQTMADVIARSMMDEETSTALKKAGVTEYSVAYDSTSAGPILVVTVTEPSSPQSVHALEVVMQQIPVSAARLQSQSDIVPSSQVTVSIIARPGKPTRSAKSQLRTIAVAVVLGLGITILSASFVDALLTRRHALGGSDEGIDEVDDEGTDEVNDEGTHEADDERGSQPETPAPDRPATTSAHSVPPREILPTDPVAPPSPVPALEPPTDAAKPVPPVAEAPAPSVAAALESSRSVALEAVAMVLHKRDRLGSTPEPSNGASPQRGKGTDSA